MPEKEVCPKCGADLGEVVETATGRKLQRCTKGSWNKETKQNEGCDYVKWIVAEPETLDETCPKCGAPLVMQTTRFGKKMKKCSTSGWDREQRVATGCDYIEWLNNGSTEKLEEKCPECGADLVLFTTAKGKKMKKCSTAGWNREEKIPTGCTYVEWLRPNVGTATTTTGGDEFFPPEEN